MDVYRPHQGIGNRDQDEQANSQQTTQRRTEADKSKCNRKMQVSQMKK